MIERITKVKSDLYRFTMTDGKIIEHEIGQIIGYDGDTVMFYNADGDLVSLNVVTDEWKELKTYSEPLRKCSVELCGEKCWYKCDNVEEETEYRRAFKYLEECSKFKHRSELLKYLIKQFADKNGIEELAKYMSDNLLFVWSSWDNDEDDDTPKCSPNFEIIIQIAHDIIIED